MNMKLDDRRNSQLEAPQPGIPVRAAHDGLMGIRTALELGLGKEDKAALQQQLDSDHKDWLALESKYQISVMSGGDVQISLPKDLSVAEAWSQFMKDFRIGQNSTMGFTESTPPGVVSQESR